MRVRLGANEIILFALLDIDQLINEDEEQILNLASGKSSKEDEKIVSEFKNTVKYKDAVSSSKVCLQKVAGNDVEVPEFVILRLLRSSSTQKFRIHKTKQNHKLLYILKTNFFVRYAFKYRYDALYFCVH